MGGSSSKLTETELKQLQEFSRYSSRKLQQVWNEFNDFLLSENMSKTSARKHHELTEAEFARFIKTYFTWETDDAFVHRLFEMFDADKSGTVSFKELVVSASVLESGSTEEKLRFLFKVYDEDSNGVLEKEELDRILSQMCAVSQALGYDTTSIRPVLSEMLAKMDPSNVGFISLEKWIEAGTKFAPILVALGIDQTTYNQQRILEGSHQWYLRQSKKLRYCNVCTKTIGINKSSVVCQVCRLVAHDACSPNASETCRITYNKLNASTNDHHWVEGNFGHADCAVCHEGHCGSVRGLAGLRCAWCKLSVHNDCKEKQSPVCELGQYRQLMLPPTAFCLRELNHVVADAAGSIAGGAAAAAAGSVADGSPDYSTIESPLVIVPPPNTTPIVVFINPASGGNQGVKLLRTFKNLINPRQVFDLQQGGPMAGLKQYLHVPNLRIICCGGDGTVGWVLAVLDKLKLPSPPPPVGVIPLGTGNDLARTLGWGGGYGGEIKRVLQQIADAETVLMDRWSVAFDVADPNAESDKVPLDIVNNYFSIGVDAEIAHRFHTMREKFPEKFNSRARNKLWYLELGTKDALQHSCKNLHKHIQLEVDGQAIDLANGPALEGLAVVNIPSMYGGANLWGSDEKMGKQDMGDRKFEIVGLFSSMHMGRIRSGLAGSAHKIAQGSVIKLTTTKLLPMQIDGEPWMQSIVTITISHKNQVVMLKHRGSADLPAESSQPEMRSQKSNSSLAAQPAPAK
ncbi:diacylglycerol kinase 1 [Capsaspora owczarzaki ATCC 30864]|uniref:Diacylglycerol kinase n=1 Tax=Capsaspora owczarzaki (strain ATCC 30864) TaxID=595528 RepID=A0A0D2VI69_CAPO3|nr:diacylglycerol kinase 1 [Capsaspora owczarzaki ATCC 30864]KJE89612.1 diacylglycerol kinase 1 [Capsaspora owczarzaki ATCC 30864]|eukprot:XP_004365918.2 diacylglycerol kinase 1 [Capsaspora owczarzaki ATCC 30864]